MTRLSATEATSHAEVLTLSTVNPRTSARRPIETMINGPRQPGGCGLQLLGNIFSTRTALKNITGFLDFIVAKSLLDRTPDLMLTLKKEL